MSNKNKPFNIIGKIFSPFGTLAYVFLSLPTLDKINQEFPGSFYINKANRHEKQKHNECSGYSSAFLLRYFDRDVSGMEMYEKMKFKVPFSGYVMPRSIINALKEYGLSYKVARGDLGTLKSRLAMGKPVIVIIGQGLKWSHYMNLVGYNDSKKELYFFDSMREPQKNEEHCSNLTIREDIFTMLWNTKLPFFRNIYIIDK